jgi:hypothetical protein
MGAAYIRTVTKQTTEELEAFKQLDIHAVE